MNPSTADLLGAVDRVNATSVIILPNNGNIRMAAEAAALSLHRQEGRRRSHQDRSRRRFFRALFAVLPDSELEDAVAASSRRHQRGSRWRGHPRRARLQRLRRLADSLR